MDRIHHADAATISGSSQAFQNFISRLKRARTRPISEALSKRITTTDYLYFIDFLSTSAMPGSVREKIFNNIKLLQPGESIRIKKKSYLKKAQPNRTLTVIRSQQGEYQLIIETKNKIAKTTEAGFPHKLKTKGLGKSAFRIDKEIELLNVSIELKESETEKNAQLEVLKKESRKGLFELGPVYNNGSNQRVKTCVYFNKANQAMPAPSHQEADVEKLLSLLKNTSAIFPDNANDFINETTSTNSAITNSNPTNPQFVAFLRRLHSAKLNIDKVSNELKKLICTEDIRKIVDYLDDTKELHLTLNGLHQNQTFRLVKKDTQLPRTLTILRTHLGEYQLMIETKSKLAQKSDEKVWIKQKLPDISGSSKEGKPAWRIDADAPIEMLNLRMILSSDEKERQEQLKQITNEVQLTQQMAALTPRICNVELGSVYKNTNTHTKEDSYRIGIYAEKSTMCLYDLFERHSLTLEDRLQIKMDILTGVKALHDNGVIHQDIKLENIVVNRVNGKYRAQLIDFGQAHSKQFPYGLSTSPLYYSPEIDRVSRLFGNFEFYKQLHTERCLANDYYTDYVYEDTNALKNPHKANDMWALGIVFNVIDCQKFPCQQDLPTTEKLTQKLLDRNRKTRFTIDDAIGFLTEQMALPATNADKPAITPAFNANKGNIPPATTANVENVVLKSDSLKKVKSKGT